MPGKPYDREFEKQRWAIINAEQKELNRSLSSDERVRDTIMLFDFWFDRFQELEKKGRVEKVSGWRYVRQKHG